MNTKVNLHFSLKSKPLLNGMLKNLTYYFILGLILVVSNFFECKNSQNIISQSFGHDNPITVVLTLIFGYVSFFIFLKNLVFSIFYNSKKDWGGLLAHIIFILAIFLIK
jgi:hypothetical protein